MYNYPYLDFNCGDFLYGGKKTHLLCFCVACLLANYIPFIISVYSKNLYLAVLHNPMASTKTNEKAQKEDDDFDVDDLLTQLSAEELEMLSKEVDPDVRKCILKFFLFSVKTKQIVGNIFMCRISSFLLLNELITTANEKTPVKWTRNILTTTLAKLHWKRPINPKMCRLAVKR